MLTINGIEVRTNLHHYVCLDCDHEFIGTRNTACLQCASRQTLPYTTLNPTKRAEFIWQQRFVTDAPFTTG